MDPNANVRERIAIYRDHSGPWDRKSTEWARLGELIRAYKEWRSMGGFAADAALLAELDRAFRTGH